MGSEPTSVEAACLNCDAPLAGAFCSACGQSAAAGRLSASDWMRDTLGAFSVTEGRLARTFFDLTRRPGRTVRAYVDGARRRYAGPFRYAFTTTAFWILALTAMREPGGGADESSAQMRERLIAAWFEGYGAALNLALIPFLAMGVHVAFLGTRTRYVEHVAVSYYLIAHSILIRGLLVLLGRVIDLPATTMMRVDAVVFPLYVLAGLWGFHRGTTRPLPRIVRVVLAFVGIAMLSVVATKGMLAYVDAYVLPPGLAEAAAPPVGD